MNQNFNKKTIGLLIVFTTINFANAQSGQGFFNERLIAQRTPSQQYNAIWKGDDLQCQAEAQSIARQLVPRPGSCDLTQNPYDQFQCSNAHDRFLQIFQSKSRDLYNGCIASRGWAYGRPPAPPAASVPAPAPEQEKAPIRSKNSIPSLASTGTGFFVSGEGHLLTNAHVIEDCDGLKAKLSTGEEFQISLLNVDAANDLALLKSVHKGAVASFRRGTAPLGERIVVFGFPLSGTLTETGNLTTGAISGLGGIGGDPSKYQISAPVQPGNSGGAVLDESGLVIGVVQSKLNAVKALKATGDIPQNVNFAIKASVVQNFLEAQGVRYLERQHGAARRESTIGTDAVKFTVIVGCYRS